MKSRIYFLLIVALGLLMVSVAAPPKLSAQQAKQSPRPADKHSTPAERSSLTPDAAIGPTPPIVTPVVNECCGGKPPLDQLDKNDASIYSQFSGQVAVMTRFDTDLSHDQVVEIFDLKDQANRENAAAGQPWYSSSTPYPLHYYFHKDWKHSNLGDVFGLTLDGQGNIYVAATSVYGSTFHGAATIPSTQGGIPTNPPGQGEIYMLDAHTGKATRFVQTSVSPTYTSGNKLPNTGSGLGNIHYSCAFDRFYISNFEDGMIYCIRPNGTIQTTWDHGHDLPNASPSASKIDDDQLQGFTPLGRRPWAVHTYNGRLYYGIWWNNGAVNQYHVAAVNTQANEIWSIALDPTSGPTQGNFIGHARLEVTLPNLPSSVCGGCNYSNPVSDITFGPAGQMLVAERTMETDVTPAAHNSQVLEFSWTWNGSQYQWTQLPVNKYSIGASWLGPGNGSGGCDYDWGAPKFMWATGDALYNTTTQPTWRVYGLQGTPTSGPGPFDNTNALLIDADDNITDTNEKTWQGDVRIPCPGEVPPQGCTAVTERITCNTKGGGGYLLALNVKNNTGQAINNVLITPPTGYTVTPGNPPIPGGSLANGSSLAIAVTITGGQPGDKPCFIVTFMTQNGCQCITQVCLTDGLPDCCATLNSDAKVVCSNGVYTFTPTITNNCGSTVQYIYFYPPAGVTMTPDHFTMSGTGLVNGQLFTPTSPVTITGVQPGKPFCFGISLHTEGMQNCCMTANHCVSVQPCGSPSTLKKK